MSKAVLLSFLTLASLTLAGQATRIKQLKIEELFDATLSAFLGDKTVDINETPLEFRQYALEDRSNDDIATATTQEVIARSGYNYENHYVASKDGHITELIRIVNPMAEPHELKQPPVVMFHGGLIDTHCWVWASPIQHHPEKYPRTLAEDGPIKSWNRSLAFVLANNGYDVWLAGTRGANLQNKGHTKYKKHLSFWLNRNHTDYLVEHDSDMLLKMNEEKEILRETLNYWDYSMDELSQMEQPQQIDRVLELTGARKVSIINYSLSSQTNLAMLAGRPEYVAKVHNFVTFAPIINNIGVNRVMKFLHTTFCLHTPVPLGTVVFTETLLSDAARALTRAGNSLISLRYLLVKGFIRGLAGSSAKYRTLLDQSVLGHVFKQLGFKEAQHYCQQIEAGRLQRYDYGPVKNKAVYGMLRPPAYDVGSIELDNWFVVSSGNDNLATVESVKQVLSTIKTEPYQHVFLPTFNHLDLTAGLENDRLINLPILRYLDHFHLPPIKRKFGANLLGGDLERLVPREEQLPDSHHIFEGHLRRRQLAD